MSRQQTLARGIRYSSELTTRYLAGFDEHSRTAQTDGLPNHPVWCLGHCAFTMSRVAQTLGGDAVPESDFTEGGTPTGGGDAQRFAIESISFNSEPNADESQYPSLARATEIFESACERLAKAIESASDEAFDADIPWGPDGATVTMIDLIFRLIFHNGTHAGQLTDLRRALEFDRVLG